MTCLFVMSNQHPPPCHSYLSVHGFSPNRAALRVCMNFHMQFCSDLHTKLPLADTTPSRLTTATLCYSVAAAGNIRPMASIPVLTTGPDSNSPEAIPQALLSHMPQGSATGSPRLPPPAEELQSEPIPEPDLRQCYQIVNGRLTVVPLQLVLPKPKPKGAMKRGIAGGAAGTEDF